VPHREDDPVFSDRNGRIGKSRKGGTNVVIGGVFHALREQWCERIKTGRPYVVEGSLSMDRAGIGTVRMGDRGLSKRKL